jgi:hypothetical protein
MAGRDRDDAAGVGGERPEGQGRERHGRRRRVIGWAGRGLGAEGAGIGGEGCEFALPQRYPILRQPVEILAPVHTLLARPGFYPKRAPRGIGQSTQQALSPLVG